MTRSQGHPPMSSQGGMKGEPQLPVSGVALQYRYEKLWYSGYKTNAPEDIEMRHLVNSKIFCTLVYQVYHECHSAFL